MSDARNDPGNGAERLWARANAVLDRRGEPLEDADVRELLPRCPGTRGELERLAARLERLRAEHESAEHEPVDPAPARRVRRVGLVLGTLAAALLVWALWPHGPHESPALVEPAELASDAPPTIDTPPTSRVHAWRVTVVTTDGGTRVRSTADERGLERRLEPLVHDAPRTAWTLVHRPLMEPTR